MGMVVTKTGEKIMIKERCRRRTGKRKMRTRRWIKLRRKMEGGKHSKQGKEEEYIYIYIYIYT